MSFVADERHWPIKGAGSPKSLYFSKLCIERNVSFVLNQRQNHLADELV